jgi:D-glycero-D-manno-heptose 1,7-bisphosphate phosphatase
MNVMPGPARPAIFVGLEGTLVDCPEFGSSAGPLRYLVGAREALGTLARAGFAIVVATNQSGLALGRFSRSEFALREALLQRQLRDEVGVELGSFFVCPHRPGAGGVPGCLCRKPAPGLLVRAARAQGLDLAASWLIGSSLDDIEAGHRAGCRTLLLQPRAAIGQAQTRLRLPDRRCFEWDEIVHELMADRHEAQPLR